MIELLVSTFEKQREINLTPEASETRIRRLAKCSVFNIYYIEADRQQYDILKQEVKRLEKLVAVSQKS